MEVLTVRLHLSGYDKTSLLEVETLHGKDNLGERASASFMLKDPAAAFRPVRGQPVAIYDEAAQAELGAGLYTLETNGSSSIVTSSASYTHSGEVTVILWFRRDRTSALETLLHIGARPHIYLNSSSRLVVSFNGATGWGTGVDAILNNVEVGDHCVAVSASALTGAGFVRLDGQEVFSDASATFATRPATLAYLGAYPGMYFLDGAIKRVMVFDRALTSLEIEEYENGKDFNGSTANLLLGLKMTEGAGATLTDVKGNTFTVTDPAWSVSPWSLPFYRKPHKAVEFNGTSSIGLTRTSVPRPGTATWLIRFRSDDAGAGIRGIVSQGNSPLFYVAGEQFQIYDSGASGLISEDGAHGDATHTGYYPCPYGEHTVVYSYNGSTGLMYVMLDGVLIHKSVTFSKGSSNTAITFGKYSTSGWLKGGIEQVVQWDRSMTPDEMLDYHHYREIDLTDPTLDFFWDMKEGAGTTITDKVAGYIADLTDCTWSSVTREAADKLFAGFVDDVEERQEMGTTALLAKTSCSDLNQIFDRDLVYNIYENMAAGDMVKDIVSRFFPGCGITTNHVQAGPVISLAIFPYMTGSKSFDELSDKTGFVWYVDKWRDLHFEDRATIIAPWAITDASKNKIGMCVSNPADRYRNKQYVVGGKALSAPRTEAFMGDGTKTDFDVSRPVAAVPTILVNGVAKTVGIQSVETGKDWYWSEDSHTISQDEAGVPLIDVDVLTVSYQHKFDLMDVVSNQSEVASRAAIEGTSGIHATIDYRNDINEADELSTWEQATFRRYGVLPKQVGYSTHSPGLKAGQLQSIVFTPNALNGLFLISSVSFAMVAQDEVRYSVQAVDGEALGSWVAFFKKLLQDRDVATINGSATIHLVTRLPSITSSDGMTLTDSMTAVGAARESRAGTALVGLSEAG